MGNPGLESRSGFSFLPTILSSFTPHMLSPSFFLLPSHAPIFPFHIFLAPLPCLSPWVCSFSPLWQYNCWQSKKLNKATFLLHSWLHCLLSITPECNIACIKLVIQRRTLEGVLLKVDVFYLNLKKTDMHKRTLRYAINRERERERNP